VAIEKSENMHTHNDWRKETSGQRDKYLAEVMARGKPKSVYRRPDKQMHSGGQSDGISVAIS
jgi:hypothetical protein